MGKFKLKIEEKAEKDLLKWYKSGQTNIIRKIERIFKELEEHPDTDR